MKTFKLVFEICNGYGRPTTVTETVHCTDLREAFQEFYKQDIPNAQILSLEEVPKEANLVSLDADDIGHRLIRLAAYHAWIKDLWYDGEMEVEEMMQILYMVGTIEERLRHNCLTQEDVERMDAWFEELNPSSETKTLDDAIALLEEYKEESLNQGQDLVSDESFTFLLEDIEEFFKHRW